MYLPRARKCVRFRDVEEIREQKIIANKISICHSERRAKPEVEVLPSEERGKTEERQRRRDMARSLGGFCIDVTFPWQATEICSHILLRLRLALLLVRFSQPAKVRLRSAHVPPFAQNDMLVVCERKCVCWRDVEGAVPYRLFFCARKCVCFSGRLGNSRTKDYSKQKLHMSF